MTVANSIKAQLEEAAHVLRQQMARIAELEAEVERLRSAAGAHDVLRSIYADTNQPTGHRLKAAGLALGVETAPLKPTEPPLDLVAEEIEPLADIIRRQRARIARMEAEGRKNIKVLSDGRVLQLDELSSNGGNGSTGDNSSDHS